MGWVFFAIFIGIAVVSALSHVLKKQQQAEADSRRNRNRPRERERERRQEKVRLASDEEQDRFLAEIERLRRKAATGGAVPVVKQAKPVPKKAPPPKARPRLEEIPTAVVTGPSSRKAPVPASPPVAPASTQEMGTVQTVKTIKTITNVADVLKPAAAGAGTAGKISGGKTASSKAEPVTPFGGDLLALLQSKNAVPMAVVLQEVLGKPKCMRS